MRINKKQWEWAILASLGLLALGLAFTGFQIHFQREGVERNSLDILFQSIKIFSAEFIDGFQSPLPWQLEVARWLAPLVFLYAATKAVIFLLRRELRGIRARFYRKHVIVAGLYEQSRPIIMEFLEKGEKVIVLVQKREQDWDALEDMGAAFISGQLLDEQILKRTNARRAQTIILMDEDDEINLRQALFLKQLFESTRHSKPDILVHASSELRMEEWVSLGFFAPPDTNTPADQIAEFKLFSHPQRGARILFNTLGPDCFSPVTADSPAVSIGIVGDNPLAQSLVLRIARLGHYANHQKPKISWWVEDDISVLELMQAFPGLKETVDLQAYIQPFRLLDQEVLEQAEQPLNVLYLLPEKETESLKILSKIQNPQAYHRLPVVISTYQTDSLNQYHSLFFLPGLNIHLIQLQEESLGREALLQEPLDGLAKGIHQNYLNSLEKRNPEKNTHWDWPYLTMDARNQNREQADHLFVKLRHLGLEVSSQAGNNQETKNLDLDAGQLEILAKMEHNRWWASKLLAGWTFAPTESPVAMTHPDLVPYEELSEEIKDYDRRAVGNIPQLLKEIGLKLNVFKPLSHG